MPGFLVSLRFLFFSSPLPALPHLLSIATYSLTDRVPLPLPQPAAQPPSHRDTHTHSLPFFLHLFTPEAGRPASASASLRSDPQHTDPCRSAPAADFLSPDAAAAKVRVPLIVRVAGACQ